ncbi:hypothetical protein C5167_046481 [Papaver somniferum]|uniref:Uncharacterized protein n=1 Tax=Papaver somniferum TaxID=3469 RepID=A0A4Y7LEP2_PAPSO|nr:hypothetical protein C5167_046481 [Papaver somniferum]
MMIDYYSKSEEELKAQQEFKDFIREKRLKESREQLVDLRDKLTNLLKQDWKQFRNVHKVISDYVFLLNSYPFKRDEIWSDVSVDLNILKELLDKLEYKSAEAEKNHYKEQYTFLRSIQKRAMILAGVDFKYMLEFADQVHVSEFKSDEIEVDNPKLVIDQFKGYEEKVNEASSEIKTGGNLNVYIDSLPVLKSVKRVLLRLEHMCLLKPDDDIEVNSKRMCLWKPDDDIKSRNAKKSTAQCNQTDSAKLL